MKRRHWNRMLLGATLAVAAGPIEAARSQAPIASKSNTPAATQPSVAEVAILQLLASSPITSPYRFTTSIDAGKIRLAGRVGTSQVHNAAIQIALQISTSIDDRIVIDTAEAHRVANVPASTLPIPGYSTPNAPLANVGGAAAYRASDGFPSTYGVFSAGNGAGIFYYPQPLMGRLDEPFAGYAPPIISYPPWATAAKRVDQKSATPTPPAPNAPAPELAPQPAPTGSQAATPSPVKDTVEMNLDARGIAVLRGSVPSQSDKDGVAQKVSLLPGVTQVINQITVRNAAPGPVGGPVPPAPPVPAGLEPRPIEQPRVDQVDPEMPLDARLAQAMSRRPALANTSVKATSRDGVAFLSGKVPTALEAMVAFRAAQQTPGIREVVDHLEFTVPDGQGKNPLIQSGRPEDVEPYLEAQIRRQVGDQAHIDRLKVSGDQLEIKGTIPKADDKPRVEAVLRLMPLLRGFRIESDLLPE